MIDTLTNKGLHRCDLVKKCLSETNLGLFTSLVLAYLIWVRLPKNNNNNKAGLKLKFQANWEVNECLEGKHFKNILYFQNISLHSKRSLKNGRYEYTHHTFLTDKKIIFISTKGTKSQALF